MDGLSAEAYRQMKEDFVSNYNGTSVWEIEVVTIGGPFSVLLRNTLIWWLFPRNAESLASGLKFLLDFLTLVMPIVVGFTVLADHVSMFVTSLLAFSVGIMLVGEKFFKHSKPTTKDKGSQTAVSLLDIPMSGRRPFFSHFRANVNLASCVGILAVDFTIFPRRYCKAETYGTGLMDVGVGSFVLSNALVAPEARGKGQHSRSLGDKLMTIARAVISTWPLLVIGGVRLLAVKSTDYQQHTSEYGVHWNFFFTLAAVRILSAIIFCFIPGQYSLWISIIIGSTFQYLLSFTDLTNIALHGLGGDDSRQGLFNAYREGIVSCAGYLTLFFAGVKLGSYLLQERKKLRDWLQVLFTLLLIDGALWLLHWFCVTELQDTSRRLANLSYVIWMLAFNLSKISGFLAVELTWITFQTVFLNKPQETKPAHPSTFCLLEAINRNGLFYFLLANLLTGLVNVTMDTIQAPPLLGLQVITAYNFCLCLVTALLHMYDISMKFW